MTRWALLALTLAAAVHAVGAPGAAPSAGSTPPDASTTGSPAAPAGASASGAAPVPGPPQPPRRGGSLLDQPPLQAPPEQWRGVAQPPAAELPVLREWLAFAADLAEAERQRQALQPFGLRILRRQQLPSLGLVLSVFRLPGEADAQQLERELRARFPDWQQELNLRYRPLQQSDEGELQLRNWGQRAMGRGQPTPAECGRGSLLAMLDGPVNTALSEFAGADLHYQSLPPAQYVASGSEAARHGTAVAALLVGRGQVAGLLPAARLEAFGVFGTDREAGLHTRSDWLILAMERVAALDPAPQAVNLSFGGARSELLERLLEQLGERLQFVAAAGNDGQAGVRYPAAYPRVLAVGAVDARLRRLRQSNFGRHLALVAPGEDIWSLDGAGHGYYASGTSFAAPFVSAALALAPSAEALLAQARDLGEPGRDPYYGAGLARLPGCR